MKRNLLILITFCISVIGYSQSVGDTFVDNFITFEITSLSPNEVEVHDYNHSGNTDVVIPNTITNSSTTYNVTSIGDDAFNYIISAGKITSVTFTLPSNIATIGNQAFRDQNLTTVTIPSSVISISQYAFWHNNLTSVTIENGIQSIGDHAFSTNQIASITIPNSVTSIGQFAFQSNQLTNATLSNSLISIGSAAFSQNQLQSIVIPNSVTSFSSAFSSNQLTSITLPSGITNIDVGAFRSNNLTHVTIPSTVTNIENTAFRDNPLATVTSQAIIPPTIFVPGINDSFWNRSVIDLTIPAGTSAAYAAGGWTGFNSVTEANALAVGDTFVVDFITYEVTSSTSNTVEVVGYNTAGGTVVNIPAIVSYSVVAYDVTNIAGGAFQSKNLTHVTISNSVTNIEISAFHTNQLTSVIIPESVTNIGPIAFLNNPLNTIISLGAIPPIITTGGGTDTFGTSSYSRSNINLVIPNNTTDEYVTDSGALWTGFKMVFEATSPTTAEVSNYDPVNGTSVVIPASVTAGSIVFDVIKIDDSAFENIGLTSVTIPNSVTEIGISAFNTNNLTSVTIPGSVTTIGTTAFATNPITNLSLGANVTDIGIGAFVDNNISDITIPSNVTFIGLLAFGNNPLTSVTSLATTPPTITTGTNDTFAFNRGNIHLHIPPNTMGAYVTDVGALWTGFNPVTEDALLSLSNTDFELTNNIKVITEADALKISYPNNIKLKNYSIYNITGAKITTGTSDEIKTSTFNSGVYILKLHFDKGIATKKVIVN
nr:leucine-rich repeat domain-containing protein [Gaetbulibacter sp. 4G1]